MMPKKPVFVIGGVTLDIIIQYEEMETLVHQRRNAQQSYLLLEEGKKIEVLSQHYFSGGGATNTAVAFKRLGYEVALLCKLGKDAPAEMVKQELIKYGVDLSLLQYAEREGTASSFVVPSLKGDRTVFAYRGANATLTEAEIPLSGLDQYGFLYITSLSRQAAECLPRIVQAAHAQQVPVAINPGISQLKLGSTFLKAALPYIDVLILNYEEATQLMLSLTQSDDRIKAHLEVGDGRGEASHLLLEANATVQNIQFNLKQFFKEALQLGVRVVVVTNGSEGVYVATREALYFHPSPSVQVVNTLGAGDAFGACFVGQLYAGFEVPDAIRSGLVNSASVIGYPDAKAGLLTVSQIEEKCATLSRDQLISLDW